MKSTPYIYASPMRYILGIDVFDQIASYLTLIPSQKPGIIITKQGLNRFGNRLKHILHFSASVDFVLFTLLGLHIHLERFFCISVSIVSKFFILNGQQLYGHGF